MELEIVKVSLSFINECVVTRKRMMKTLNKSSVLDSLKSLDNISKVGARFEWENRNLQEFRIIKP